MNEIHRDLGALSVEVRSLKEEMVATRQELKDMNNLLQQARGGWKAVATIAAIIGGLVGFIATALKIRFTGN